MKKFASYLIALFAGAISVLLLFKVRDIVLILYLTSAIENGNYPWGYSLINISITLVMGIGCLVYFLITQHHFSNKCNNRQQYISSSLKLILPVILAYISSNILYYIITWLDSIIYKIFLLYL